MENQKLELDRGETTGLSVPGSPVQATRLKARRPTGVRRRRTSRTEYRVYFDSVGKEIANTMETSQDRFQVSLRPTNYELLRLNPGRSLAIGRQLAGRTNPSSW